MDVIALILEIVGGFLLLGLGLWIGYFSDIYHWVAFRRTFSKKNYGVIAIFSKDGRARLYKANLDDFFFSKDGRTRMLRQNCVFRGKDDIPTIEFDIDSSEPMRRFVYITTDVPRVDKNGNPVFEQIPRMRSDVNGKLLLDDDGKMIPVLDDHGKQVYDPGNQIIDKVEVPYRAVDVNPLVAETDKHLFMDWAMSLMTSNIGLIILLVIVTLAITLLGNVFNGYVGINNAGKLDSISTELAQCLKNFAVGNMTNFTGRIAVIGG